MIISHKHKTIFIKTSKTASSSLEYIISEQCGPLDVITPLVENDEQLKRECNVRTAQNLSIPFRWKHIKPYLSSFIQKGERFQFYSHIPIKEFE